VTGGAACLLGDDSLLYLAVADVTVDGERLEGVGVTPDVVVESGLEWAGGADPQLEAAIDLAVR
jgi:carboxyl-terminal processing protease